MKRQGRRVIYASPAVKIFWREMRRRECQRRYVIGVDEAGRGSIVGEMFIAAFAAPPEVEEELLSIGVRDSKKLSPNARARLYRKLVEMGEVQVTTVPPRLIDRENLNKLTESAVLEVIRRITRRLGGFHCVTEIIIDKFGSPRRLPVLLKRLGFHGLLVVEEKADERYPHVAAASIVAKHLRDRRIRILSSLYGVEGSGYPADPRTMEWVRRQLAEGKRPPIIRYSWASLREFGYGRKTGKVSRRLDEWLRGSDSLEG